MAAAGCQAPFRNGQTQPDTDRVSTTADGPSSTSTSTSAGRPLSSSRDAPVSSRPPSSTTVVGERLSPVKTWAGRSSHAPFGSAGRTAATQSEPTQRVGAPNAATPSKVSRTPDDSRSPDLSGGFVLTVRTSRGEIRAPVAALSVPVRADGTADPIDPPHGDAQQWRTAAWIEQSSFPGASAGGASFIYGHACHHHVCSFTRLRDAQVGDPITVITPSSVLIYRLCATGRSAKTGNLAVPSCDGVGVDLVLVTCEYEQGDQSSNDLVVAATLVRRTGSGN